MARLNGCMIDQRWKSDDDDTIAAHFSNSNSSSSGVICILEKLESSIIPSLRLGMETRQLNLHVKTRFEPYVIVLVRAGGRFLEYFSSFCNILFILQEYTDLAHYVQMSTIFCCLICCTF